MMELALVTLTQAKSGHTGSISGIKVYVSYWYTSTPRLSRIVYKVEVYLL